MIGLMPRRYILREHDHLAALPAAHDSWHLLDVFQREATDDPGVAVRRPGGELASTRMS